MSNIPYFYGRWQLQGSDLRKERLDLAKMNMSLEMSNNKETHLQLSFAHFIMQILYLQLGRSIAFGSESALGRLHRLTARRTVHVVLPTSFNVAIGGSSLIPHTSARRARAERRNSQYRA